MDKNDVRVAAMHALMVPEHEMVDSVARAILAERKRCAAAVRAERLAGPSDDPTDIAYDLAIEHAHAAIWRAA